MSSKTLISKASYIAPDLIARLAMRRLTRPRGIQLSATEQNFLDSSESVTIEFEGQRLHGYHWPGQGPKTLFIHGWEGHTGQFRHLIPYLHERGHDIWAFDAPSHGRNRNIRTDVFEFAALILKIYQEWDIRQVVTHSFGAVALSYALSSTENEGLDKWVMFTSPDRFTQRIEWMADYLKLSNSSKEAVIRRLQRRLPEDIHSLNVSDFVRRFNTGKALAIYDPKDRIIPGEQTLTVVEAMVDAEIVSIKGGGHFRILRHPDALSRCDGFLRSSHI